MLIVTISTTIANHDWWRRWRKYDDDDDDDDDDYDDDDNSVGTGGADYTNSNTTRV